MILLRAGLLVADAVPFNSDEAVVALMARHILGGERPIFFYGQAYLGSLDAWLVAGAFRLLGEGVLAVRIVQVVLYAGTILSAYALARRAYPEKWIARFVALWLAAPPVVMTLYATASLGGYGEALLIGNLIWLAALRVGQGASGLSWAALGFLTGLGLWVFPLTGIYALPAWWHLVRARPPAPAHPPHGGTGGWVTAALGALVGAAPWLWATIAQGPATLAELGGSALTGVSGGSPLAAFAARLLSLVLFGPTVVLGLRPPWSVDLLAPLLAPLAVAVYSAGLYFVLRRRGSSHPTRTRLLPGAALTLCAAFVLTPFGADPSGRYFLPLVIVLAFVTAEALGALRARRRWLAHGLGLGLVAFNFWGTVQSAARQPGLTTQFDPVAQVDQRDLPGVMAFLRANGEMRGYANYWVTFPLAFLSGEDLIYSARLPYHLDFRYTPRDDRYPPYAQAVRYSPRVAYLTTRHPPLDERLRAGLAGLGVTYREHVVGDFHIFYALSRRVSPEELGLP
jgi:hypothetical protein